ncbi:Rtt106p NDAI_0F03590 [Naumovozyma dairenensis CBS 421]|uniref:Histone chaperone RTT106 n=1 Tax=Naumovozyma dairenensis (strain ATCC 10597 / BCRC 20456 / CBS 421 / NBRC 0211 / NRRL Y-12639) TaxID=1071378 RepID=G0WD16_NAUDC|nr:hypothetical protein NDAI_0F03590 [Naumovozyma dairenensis CBS 421]CCD25677.1 hypothetical protein NDAI_0F03590 [Naumovozyma dairenensis CBS 421]
MSDQFLSKLPEELSIKIKRITSVIPQSLEIFEQLYNYAIQSEVESESAIKKRKLAEVPSSASESQSIDNTNTIFKLENVSILSPLRKKLNLVLHLVEGQPMLSLLKDNHIEFSIFDLKTNIQFATFLPVPEKPNIIYLFINYKNSNDSKYFDPLLITLNKQLTLASLISSGDLDQSTKDFLKCIEYIRRQAILTGFRIFDPFNPLLSSEQKSFHVECHRGTKEGTLYFLPDHIIFGFKKPILLFESSNIESITYSSITRLTFNVTLITKSEEKFEFSMIDQSEYSKIDEYVKRKQVMDKSMSDELKAKKSKKTEENEGANGDDNQEKLSALQEAEQQINSINDIPFSSDDEENDQDFHDDDANSSDSGRSDSEAEDDDSVDNGEQAEESVDGDDEEEEGEDEDEEGEDEDEEEGEAKQERENSSKAQEGANTLFNFDNSEEADDIPIELDEEDDSGVEYD